MLIKTDNILFPKPGPRARRGIRDSRGMSSYDARFHQTFQCLSLNVKGRYWERDIAEHEVWLHNWRQHQVKAGVVRALERGSRLRIPRRRASPMLKSSWASASTRGWLVDIFLCLTEMRLRFAKMYPYVPLRGCNKYKKRKKGLHMIFSVFKFGATEPLQSSIYPTRFLVSQFHICYFSTKFICLEYKAGSRFIS